MTPRKPLQSTNSAKVFMMLTWEGQGQGNPSQGGDGSLRKYVIKRQKHGEEVFAKVYRYVVVRARPKQGYSMCL